MSHNFPRSVVHVLLPPERTDALCRVARVVPLQQRPEVVLRPGLPLPGGVLLRDVHPELLHLPLELGLVVAQRALEEVAGGLGQVLQALAVEPAAAARGPKPDVLGSIIVFSFRH